MLGCIFERDHLENLGVKAVSYNAISAISEGEKVMCGIVGVHRLSSQAVCWQNERELFLRMLNIQKHRGPDDQGIAGYHYGREKGYFLDTNDICEEGMDGILGFNRLSIRDLSLNGHQPMQSPDGKVLLAFNGEIYNAEDYREELRQKGWRFKSKTDTEVILALYLMYGLNRTLEILNGMFAIVLIDLREHRLFLVRDRFGIKPLYYMVHEGRLYYASEYKSFLMIPTFEPQIDMDVLNETMIFISAPNKVLLKGIKQLCPGEILTVNEDRIQGNKYFNIEQYVHDRGQASFQEKQKMLDEVLSSAVRRQMISDVKVGCQLSGGVDSSLVSYYACSNQSNAMKDSISIVFQDDYMNEEKYVLQAAKTLSLKSHRYVLNVEYLIRTMRRAIWHLESIMAVANCNALLLLTEKAKENVTVLLSGEGADEIFGGYPIYNQLYFRQKYVQNKEIHRLLNGNKWLKRKLMGGESEELILAMVRGDIYVEPCNAAEMLNRSSDTNCVDARCDLLRNFQGSYFDKLVKYEMTTYLPDLLLRQDKMSMANSIENRVPFLDNDVVEASFQIPYEMMIGINKSRYEREGAISGTGLVSGKYILKEICAKKFGESFAYRGKGGFGLPLKYYMGMPEFRQMYEETVKGKMRERSLLNANYVEWLYQRLDVLDWQEVELLWRAINVELYAQMFIDRKYGAMEACGMKM